MLYGTSPFPFKSCLRVRSSMKQNPRVRHLSFISIIYDFMSSSFMEKNFGLSTLDHLKMILVTPTLTLQKWWPPSSNKMIGSLFLGRRRISQNVATIFSEVWIIHIPLTWQKNLSRNVYRLIEFMFFSVPSAHWPKISFKRFTFYL